MTKMIRETTAGISEALTTMSKLNQALKFLKNPPKTEGGAARDEQEKERRRAVIAAILGDRCIYPRCQSEKIGYYKRPGFDTNIKLTKSMDFGRERFVGAIPQFIALCTKHSNTFKADLPKVRIESQDLYEWMCDYTTLYNTIPDTKIQAEAARIRGTLGFHHIATPQFPNPTLKQLEVPVPDYLKTSVPGAQE